MEFQVIRHESVFEAGTVPFLQCHASTVCLLPDGTPAAAWFGGDREGAPGVAIWFSRRMEDGWTRPVKAAEGSVSGSGAAGKDPASGGGKVPDPGNRIGPAAECVPCWNPVLFWDGQELLLFYKEGKEIPAWRTMLTRSADLGRSWSPAVELVPGDAGGRGPVKNKCIRLADGALLAPASLERGAWDCFADRSEDNGRTWKRSAPVPLDRSRIRGSGVIQPSLWQDDAGAVHMLMRSSEGAVYRSDSADGGRTWSAARRTELPNNNSGLDLVRMDSGLLALAYNPVAVNWGPRTPIALSVSADNGASWSRPYVLEHEPCDRNEYRAEFSYPAIVAKDRDVYLTYTRKRETIAFWQIRVAER